MRGARERDSKEVGIIMKLSMRVLGALALLLVMAGSAAAQVMMTGEVKDREGKPYADLTVIIKSKEYGSKYEVKTDKKGQFLYSGMRIGIYLFTLKNNAGQIILQDLEKRLSAAGDPIVIDLREMEAVAAKENPEIVAARKKQEEDSTKFEDMKTHFEAGKTAADQARAVREEMQRAPADQKPALQERLKELNQTAVAEYQAAEKAAPEKDSNLHKVLANLGQAYDSAGMFAEASASYEKAIALRPTEAGYYMGWGTALARLGKVEEAGATCDKAAAIDKTMSSNCWRNIGIVLYNASKLKDAVGPLRKATELDPNYADTWYLLGASLVAAMDYKKEGEKFITVVQPGTAEAYQKYLELAPNGRYAGDAKASLDMLASLGAGIDTKVKATKKKP